MTTIFAFAMHGHVVNAGDAQLLRMANIPPGTIDTPTASIPASTAQPGAIPSMTTTFAFAMHGHVVNAGDAELLRMANIPPGTIDTPTASIQASEGSVPPWLGDHTLDDHHLRLLHAWPRRQRWKSFGISTHYVEKIMLVLCE